MKIDKGFIRLWMVLFTSTVWITAILTAHMEWQTYPILLICLGGPVILGFYLATKYKIVSTKGEEGKKD